MPGGVSTLLAHARGGIRTHDLLLRRQALYPAELRTRYHPRMVCSIPLGESCSLIPSGVAHKQRSAAAPCSFAVSTTTASHRRDTFSPASARGRRSSSIPCVTPSHT